MSAPFNYGGQAVIEGVMIRGPHSLAVAVRRGENDIVVQQRQLEPLAGRYPILALPLVRGSIQLFEALMLGIDALMFSANEAAGPDERPLTRKEMVGTTVTSFAIAILLFVIGPTWLVNWVSAAGVGDVGRNLLEGLLRLLVLLAYLALISRMPDIRRVLEYHGAEHKVIHALEHGEQLTVANVRPYSILHPRCGTSFLLLVALTSIILFSLFGWPGFWERLLIRLAMLPVVAGIAYELIRASGRSQSPLWRPIIAPGLWLQKLTTREPDDAQIEVALRALTSVIDEPKGVHAHV